jgi:hypothetical protein
MRQAQAVRASVERQNEQVICTRLYWRKPVVTIVFLPPATLKLVVNLRLVEVAMASRRYLEIMRHVSLLTAAQTRPDWVSVRRPQMGGVIIQGGERQPLCPRQTTRPLSIPWKHIS